MPKSSILLVLFALSPIPVLSCPFDEAGIEVTILAHTAITDAIETGDFSKVSSKIVEQKYLYEYFEKTEDKPLYQPLLDASENKDATRVKELLDHSLVLEIDELLSQVEESFGKYQKTRLRLIKANKHLKALTTEEEPLQLMKSILKSIGNPGLMGVGEKKSDKAMFIKHKGLLLDMIS